MLVKGSQANVFALRTIVSHASAQPSLLTWLAIAARRKLILHTWRDGEYASSTEVAIAHQARSIAFPAADDAHQQLILLGFSTGSYGIISSLDTSPSAVEVPALTPTSSTGLGLRSMVGGMGGIGRVERNLVIGLGSSKRGGEAMVVDHGHGIVVTVEKDRLIPQHQLVLETLGEGADLACASPFLLSTSPSSIAVHSVQSLRPIQMIVLSAPGRLTAAPGGALLLGENGTIRQVKMRRWKDQIDELIALGEYEECLEYLSGEEGKVIDDNVCSSALRMSPQSMADLKGEIVRNS